MRRKSNVQRSEVTEGYQLLCFFFRRMEDIQQSWEAFNNFENYVFSSETENFTEFIEMWNIRYLLHSKKWEVIVFQIRGRTNFIWIFVVI